ncbi:hypothetical protein SteCoe_1262 [Stentor coeruleus]|uniref:Uncharacterized protein n=1 Tax=Stentor coeruleus TaxID=5963 RepID=A0A1R2D266_9CILI|nr:hypothetical protein SteCoe_1262 [Stentor coeruleus]
MELQIQEDYTQILEKSDSIQVITKQLESEFNKVQKSLKSESKRLDRLASQLQLTKQQIELYTKEAEKALEDLKDTNWRITKELCSELRKISNPSKTLIDVCEKIMLVLDQNEKTFQSFKALTKNFSLFKTLMSFIQTQNLSDSLINSILPIWKNQTIVQAKLYKISKCGCLLALWITLLVEHNLKTETINSSKRKIPELDQKINASKTMLSGLEKQMEIINEMLSRKKSEFENRPDIAHEEFTARFDFFGSCQKCDKENDTRAKKQSVLCEIDPNLMPNISFPNFADPHLYDENSIKMIEHNIIYEGKHDDTGCFRIKFFCL